MAAILTGIRFALVDLRLTQVSRIAGMTLATEAVLSINTLAAMAGIAQAVVDVDFARGARIAGRTLTRVAGNEVVADSAVLTRLRLAVVDVDLTA